MLIDRLHVTERERERKREGKKVQKVWNETVNESDIHIYIYIYRERDRKTDRENKAERNREISILRKGNWKEHRKERVCLSLIIVWACIHEERHMYIPMGLPAQTRMRAYGIYKKVIQCKKNHQRSGSAFWKKSQWNFRSNWIVSAWVQGVDEVTWVRGWAKLVTISAYLNK